MINHLHGSYLSVIRMYIVVCGIIAQRTIKLCTDLQERISRESIYAKLSCFIQ